jgi:hypothetical protein
MLLLTIHVQCFRTSDVIVMKQRVQFNHQRTPWTPLELRLNPRFGIRKTTEITGVASLLLKFHPKEEQQDKGSTGTARVTTREVASLLAYSGLEEENTLKLSFSVEDYVTPWITVMRTNKKNDATGTGGIGGETHFLTGIDFIFQYVDTYAGSRILSIKHVAHYSDENMLGMTDKNNLEENIEKIPKVIKLNYHWEEVFEKDSILSITILYMLSFFGTFSVLIFVLKDFK